jgi:hypothetical protein
MSQFSEQLFCRAKSGELGDQIAQAARADFARAGKVYQPTVTEMLIAQQRAAKQMPALKLVVANDRVRKPVELARAA